MNVGGELLYQFRRMKEMFKIVETAIHTTLGNIHWNFRRVCDR